MNEQIDLKNIREDEGRGIEYARRKSRKKHRRKRILRVVLLLLLALVTVAAAGGAGMFFSGQRKLREKGNASRPELKPVKTKEVKIETELIDEDSLKYNGSKYRYNENMINLLFMGVDTTGSLEDAGKERETASAGNAGQTDTLILAALNNEAKTVTLIPVNRDTMTEISIYDRYGAFAGKQKEQVALAYAYGDGEKKSAELTREAVSNLFYGLPVHGYFSVNTSAISLVNDMVGGVEVTLQEDMTGIDPSYTKGSRVLLKGASAESYLRVRGSVGDGSNLSRMARQKEYLTALAQKALEAAKGDIGIPLSVYNTVSDYMVTDISPDELTYLVSQAVSCRLDEDFIRNIPGKTDSREVFMRFYPDEQALYELILDVFYKKVS